MFKRLEIHICVMFFAAVLCGSCTKHEAGTSVAPAVGENQPGHDEACGPPNEGGSTMFTCEFDSQCVICHDGSLCGTVVNQQELDRRGAQCQLEDAGECEYAAARCCQGHCTLCSF